MERIVLTFISIVFIFVTSLIINIKLAEVKANEISLPKILHSETKDNLSKMYNFRESFNIFL